MKRVMIIAGGTGGHIFPALAVAEQLKKQGIAVFWLGTRHGMEAKLVSDHYPMQFISVSGVRKKGVAAKLVAPMKLLLATIKAYHIIKATKPSVVLAMGGYVAAPGGLAAKLARVPLVIHEQNAKAGLTNRLLAKIANIVLQGFENAFNASVITKTVGNPVRDVMLSLPTPQQRFNYENRPLRVLVMGGSQGAQALNQCMVKVWEKFSEADSVEVWHQSGERELASMQAAYTALPIKAKVEAFIDEVAQAYAWADIIVCRAGAMTISELAAAGAASILIPYPFAVDQHQHYNARYLSDNGAAILIDQKELTPARMFEILQQRVDDRGSLLKMAQNAKKLAYEQAAQQVAQECIKINQIIHS